MPIQEKVYLKLLTLIKVSTFLPSSGAVSIQKNVPCGGTFIKTCTGSRTTFLEAALFLSMEMPMEKLSLPHWLVKLLTRGALGTMP